MTGLARRTLLCTGDPNGIGPEVAVAAVRRTGCAPVLVSDRAVVEWAVRVTGGTEVVRDHHPDLPPEPGTMDLIDVGALPTDAHRPGTVTAAAGRATLAYTRAAIHAAATGTYRAVVAAPHSETAIDAAAVSFSGYPSLLADVTGTPPDRVFLLLVGGGLRVVHATLHRRLADAITDLDADRVVAAGRALHQTLDGLGMQGRTAVFGINPHAGEDGLFGDDDERVTAPAVARLRQEGYPVDGPAGADTLLAANEHAGYVAAYHDQGHIPVKLLAGRTSVALSIGAGVSFCSVGHGSAFDLAGSGRADPEAMVRALHTVGERGEVPSA
ncbi:MAG: terephthalate dihydrodiol dehydrogenase [Pseudonocardiaceae bacterium]|nr:MAG: terephthalate dihydrodiol dehydrogenase [Pseudonocardiaceae bacterium]